MTTQEGSDFDAKSALKWLGLIVLTLAALALVWYGGTFFLLTFGGILVAVILRAPTGLLVRRAGLPDWLAYTIVLVAIVALIVGFGFLVGPQLIEQVGQFSSQVPSFIADARSWLGERSWGSWLVEQFDSLTGNTGGGQAGGAQDAGGAQQQGGTGSPAGGGLLSTATGFARSFGISIANVAYVIVLGVFLAVNPRLYRAGLVRLFPRGAQNRASEVLDELGTTLKFWLMGQLALMTITGVLTGIGLVILGVPMALGLAVFVGLMDFVPFIGPIIGFIPILIVAAAQGAGTLLWALILYVVIQQIEGNVLVPLIQQRVVSLPPALTIAGVFLGGALFGILGAILATPLLAVIFVLVKMLYVHDVLGQRVEVPGGEEPAPT